MNITNIKIKNFFTKRYLVLVGFAYIQDKKEKIDREKLYCKVNEKKYNIKFFH